MTAQPQATNLTAVQPLATQPRPAPPARVLARCPRCRQTHDGLRAEIACATRQATQEAFEAHLAARYGEVQPDDARRLQKALAQTMGAVNAMAAVEVVLKLGWRPPVRGRGAMSARAWSAAASTSLAGLAPRCGLSGASA